MARLHQPTPATPGFLKLMFFHTFSPSSGNFNQLSQHVWCWNLASFSFFFWKISEFFMLIWSPSIFHSPFRWFLALRLGPASPTRGWVFNETWRIAAPNPCCTSLSWCPSCSNHHRCGQGGFDYRKAIGTQGDVMDVKRMLCGKVEDVELLYEDWDFDQGKWGFTHPKISCKIHAMLCTISYEFPV